MMINRPTLLLDEAKARQNIRKMVQKAKANETVLRPHFKTHQSHQVGEWFREEGIRAITVSSVQMAQYFAQNTWNDITIAFPVNILEIAEINSLAQQTQLNLLVESEETTRFLISHIQAPIGVFIKIDVGTHRTGVAPDNHELITTILTRLQENSLLRFKGFLAHAGHSYRARTVTEIRRVHQESIACMQILKTRYQADFPSLQLSVGDTPTCSQEDDFTEVDELRPGNFVFYDAMQLQIGACTADQIAVAMACPIVALHPERNELLLYGGGVHFSKDHLDDVVLGKHFGLVASPTEKGWGKPIDGAILQRVSQEHGIVKAPREFIEQQAIGKLLYILPVHSCMTADLMKRYLTLDGKVIEMMR